MRICIRFADPMLARALMDLLRAHGHEAGLWTQGAAPCGLRIQTEMPAADGSPPPCATLVLRRTSERPGDEDPASALRQALRERGVAIWPAPLDTRLLLDVLGRAAGRAEAPPRPARVPDLARAPHPWLVLDVTHDRVLAANDEARALLDLPREAAGYPLAELPVAGSLREVVCEQSEGLRAGKIAGALRTAAWWTDGDGHRVLCLLESGSRQSMEARNQQSLADLGQMAATLAHEIRNPVASLAGALDLLEHEEDPYDRAEILGMARERLKQLARLLERTLSLARPIRGTVERVPIGPVIASAVSTVTLDPGFKDLSMEVIAPDDETVVLALEGPLLQALTNILINAAQAQQGRGMVRIHVGRDGRRALIRVHDEGPGIPLDKHAEIFKPFYTTKPAGTGLGLAQVRRTMEALGGAIVIEDVAEGACLRVELPLAPED